MKYTSDGRVDLTLPYLHIVEWSAPVQKELHPNGEIVDSYHDRNDLEMWAIDFKLDNGGVAESYVIDNPTL
jgi:hypothetical protein